MICIRNISKFYNSKDLKYRALYNVSFSIKSGEYVIIHGKEGSGKTTLLNILGCIDKFDDGDYIFESKSITCMSDFELSRFRNNNFGFVFGHTKLIPQFNLFRNVELPLLYSNYSKKEREKIVLKCLDMMMLLKYKYDYAEDVPRGIRQKICLARALVNGARIILSDELTEFLNEDNLNEIIEIFNDLNKKGFTIIVVSKLIEKFNNANRIINLNDGIVV